MKLQMVYEVRIL